MRLGWLAGWASDLADWASDLAGWASGLAGWASGLAGWALGLAGWASGLVSWASGLDGGGWMDEHVMYIQTHEQSENLPFYRALPPKKGTFQLD